ncbi:uncharacterized protein LOC125683140 [Ostrea edulis]|uniref:uncharacterized protein LOC125683140 n=1 Tax=Ostrea edulis TaxID=37623 RepID=UPI0024AED29A|nr:uncharacterized protein LOC125683140 [Ostrea edulis]
MENSDEENNFLILIQALKFVTEGLKEYTIQGLDDLYNRLRRRVSASGPCTQQCNRNHRDATRWCQTCQNWKKELEKYMRSAKLKNNTKWYNVEISYFSGVDTTKAKDELFRVFIQGQGSLPVTFDIQTMLSLFQNCKYFDIGDDVLLLTSIRRVRNYDFAHSEDFKLTNKQLKKDINSLCKLFRHPSIRRCPSASEILSKLRRLQRNDRILIQSETRRFFIHIKENFITNESLKTLTCSPHDQKTGIQHTTSLLIISIIAGFLLLRIFYRRWEIYNHPEMRAAEKVVCKVMEYKKPFQLNFDFEFYRSQHGPLIGRQWLLNDFDYLMYSTTRGVLVVAETGYGKSAIVSHLICQNDRRLPGNWIYERIVSYHLCRHDSRRSLSPGLFVKNLAGSFSSHIANFHDILKANSFYEAYFKEDECLKDPEGCFDFLIIQSLTHLKQKQEIYIIIIDALDECTANSGLNILTLLERRMKRLPSFIKFLITTRNTTSITLKMRSLLHVYELDSQSPNNAKDIEMIMRYKVDKISRDKYDNLKTKFKTSNITLMVSSALKYAKHNMLYLHYAFEVWIQNKYVPLSETPSTFEEFFHYNLERIFGENDEFDKIRGIFEVLCAAEEPISDREILRIADIPKENHIQIWKLFGNEMSHFIKHSYGKISIAHVKLSQFLTDKRRRYGKFYVSEQEGNLKFASFWLSKVEQQMSFHNIDIVQLALYVSRSKNKSQEKNFLHYGKRFRKEFDDDFFLHRAALSINSYQAMVLLIEISGRDIEKRDNTGNFSSAYLASTFGNHRTLDALLQHGANIHFVRKSPEIVKRFIGVEDFCKQFAHWEYSLLNVASQNGHLDVVSTLLKHGVNVPYTNSLGLNSFHLAAEYGHIELMRVFLRYFKDTFDSSLDHSLYLSASNGHHSVVELLLYHGAVDRCLPCNMSQYWTKFHETRLQIIDDMDDLETVNYVFKDDRRFIRCETALEVSLQNGYDEIVKLLIDKFPSALKCKESGGRTPLLTAIRFRRYNALKQILLHENARNITCLFNRNRWKKLDLNDKERNEYLENQCPFNSSISHLCAMYGDLETIKLLQTYGLINWSERNPDGDTPLHVASCKGHIKTIKLYEQNHEGELWNVRAKNGSTLMHSAATCHRYRLLSYLLEKQHDHVFDDMNLGISHYLTKTGSHGVKERNELLNIEDNVKERIIREIFLVDVYNRTPLHYAAVHGNVDYLSFLISLGLEHTAWTRILNMADYTSRIIIELAFANVPLYHGLKTMNYESVSIKPQEKFIYLLLGNVIPSRYYVQTNYHKFVEMTAEKNSSYLMDILHYFFQSNNYPTLKVWSHLLSHDVIDPVMFSFIPKLKYMCHRDKNNILHKIIQDEKRTVWVHEETSFKFDKLFLLNWKNITKCLDKNGHNLLHRAIMGGNYAAFIYLLNKGVPLNGDSRDEINLLQLVVKSAPTFQKETLKIRLIVPELRNRTVRTEAAWNFDTISKEVYNYDKIAEVIVRKSPKLDVNRDFFCRKEEKNLSIVHLIAAKGFTSMISEIKHKFGNNILECKNQNEITSSQMLYFFGHMIKTMRYSRHRGGVYLENSDAFSALLLKYVFDFKTFVYPKNSVARKCNGVIRNRRNVERMHLCTDKLEAEVLKLFQQYVKWSGVKSGDDFARTVKYNEFHDIFSKTDKPHEMNIFESYLHKLSKSLQNRNQNVRERMKKIQILQTSLVKSDCLKSKLTSRNTSLACLQRFQQIHSQKQKTTLALICLFFVFSYTKGIFIFLFMSTK